VVLEPDCSLILYDRFGEATVVSVPFKAPRKGSKCTLTLQDDCNLVLSTTKGVKLWSTESYSQERRGNCHLSWDYFSNIAMDSRDDARLTIVDDYDVLWAYTI
jgi:hypothetical protein